MKKKLKTAIVSFLLVVQGATAQTYPEMITVEGGTFIMGDTEMEGNADERPAHEVTLKTFQMSKTPVTVAQYRAYCNATGKRMPEPPDWGWIDNHPVVNVNWYDAVAYTEWLSDKFNENYRLPTEAEWEYAARGGNKSNGSKYAGAHSLDTAGWYKENSNSQTQPVAQKCANELGLYDMSGNVWEWCSDWYGKDYYANSPGDNPQGPESDHGHARVARGGGWDDFASYCRVAFRSSGGSSFGLNVRGFRVVLSR